MRKVDYIMILICACAAALCGIGSPYAAPLFVVSSTLGLFDSIKKKVLSAALINGIFLTLNLFIMLENFFCERG